MTDLENTSSQTQLIYELGKTMGHFSSQQKEVLEELKEISSLTNSQQYWISDLKNKILELNKRIEELSKEIK